MEEAPRGCRGSRRRAPLLVLQMPRVLGVPAHPCAICVPVCGSSWSSKLLEAVRNSSKLVEVGRLVENFGMLATGPSNLEQSFT
eukprot:11127984-Alexandrium_andersonii.AAC.1